MFGEVVDVWKRRGKKRENDGGKKGWRRERESWNEKDARSRFRLSKYGEYVL
jgi:hypothetical protein